MTDGQYYIDSVNNMMNLIERVREIRDGNKLPLKKPVLKLKIISQNQTIIDQFKHFEDVIKENCNAFEIEYDLDESKYLHYEKNYSTTYKKKLGLIIRTLFETENNEISEKVKKMREDLKKLEAEVKKEREAAKAAAPVEEKKE